MTYLKSEKSLFCRADDEGEEQSLSKKILQISKNTNNFVMMSYGRLGHVLAQLLDNKGNVWACVKDIDQLDN